MVTIEIAFLLENIAIKRVTKKYSSFLSATPFKNMGLEVFVKKIIYLNKDKKLF